MAFQPEVAKAALAGELSLEQATAVSDGVAANPAKAQELIEAAKRSSMPELNDAVAKVKADSTDLEERRRARHGRSRPALATSPGATVLAIVCP